MAAQTSHQYKQDKGTELIHELEVCGMSFCKNAA